MIKPLKKFSLQKIRFTNNLPYSLTVEYCPNNKFIDRIYYKFTDAAGNRIFYRTVLIQNTDEFTRIPNIQVNVPGTLRIEEAIGNKILSNTEYAIEIPELILGSTPLSITAPSNFRINLSDILADIDKYYGPSAYDTRTKLQFSATDWYSPSSDTIYYAAGGRNLVHELIHASRKSLLVSSRKGLWYEKLEMLEEFFAEGLSDQIKGLYSTHLYNFDYYGTDPALGSENLQSSWGGIGFLEQCRYFLLSAAFWKLNFQYNKLTGRYLGKEFNSLYYARISSGEQPSREMFVSILACLIPTIEGVNTRSWIDDKPIFNTEITTGPKTWIYVQDYAARNETLGICTIYSYETFPNGSDWIDEQNGLKYNKNDTDVHIKIEKVEVNHLSTIVDFTTKVPRFTGGFGAIKLYLHDSPVSEVALELMEKEPFGAHAFHCPWGVYKITINGQVRYRFLGSDPSDERTIVSSTDEIVSIMVDGKWTDNDLPANMMVFYVDKDQIIKVKTNKRIYERIIKSGKNHLFL